LGLGGICGIGTQHKFMISHSNFWLVKISSLERISYYVSWGKLSLLCLFVCGNREYARGGKFHSLNNKLLPNLSNSTGFPLHPSRQYSHPWSSNKTCHAFNSWTIIIQPKLVNIINLISLWWLVPCFTFCYVAIMYPRYLHFLATL